MNYRPSLFWDTKPEKIDKNRNKNYIIERVLEFGDDNEVKSLFREYKKEDISKVVDNSRSLSLSTKALWTKVLK